MAFRMAPISDSPTPAETCPTPAQTTLLLPRCRVNKSATSRWLCPSIRNCCSGIVLVLEMIFGCGSHHKSYRVSVVHVACALARGHACTNMQVLVCAHKARPGLWSRSVHTQHQRPFRFCARALRQSEAGLRPQTRGRAEPAVNARTAPAPRGPCARAAQRLLSRGRPRPLCGRL